MKTILVPMDGSHLAERAYPYATMLARLMSASIRLVRVITDDELLASRAVYGSGAPVSIAPTVRVETIENTLDLAAARLRNEGMLVETEVAYGRPAEQIAAVAARVEAAMIVMATHGYGGLRRWALGSVADEVAHLAACPLIMIREDSPEQDVPVLKRIMVPVDGSEFANQILTMACDLAKQANAEVMLLRAVRPQLELSLDGYVEVGDIEAAQEALAQAELETQASEVRKTGARVSAMARIGYAAEAIVDEAITVPGTLIAMTTHGRSGLSRWALGSVADKVLHASTVPLLLIRPDAQRTQTIDETDVVTSA